MLGFDRSTCFLSYLKFKDTFTLANLFLSFFSVILVFQGHLQLASIFILINILVLDILDGWVARITKTGNEFGKQFDSVVDFVGSSIMVSFFVYVELIPFHAWVALLCGFVLVFVGVMREVRSRIEPIARHGYFVGFPRNAAVVLLVTFLNTSLFKMHAWTAVPYVALLAYFQLSHVPFIGNDKRMLMAMPRMKFYLVTGTILVALAAFFGHFWNMICFILCFYLVSPYALVEKEVWDDIKTQLARLQK